VASSYSNIVVFEFRYISNAVLTRSMRLPYSSQEKETFVLMIGVKKAKPNVKVN